MNKIKILMYTTVFSSGGAEKTVLDISNNLDEDKYIIYLVVGRKNLSSYYQFLKKSDNIHYINYGLGDEEDFKISGLLAKSIDEIKPDICFAPGIFTNFILMEAIDKSDYKPKVVLRESGYVSGRNLSIEQKEMIKNYYNKADKIIAITSGIKKDLIRNYDVNRRLFEIIYNPLDIDDIEHKSNIKLEDDIFNNIIGKKIVSVGRLAPVKDHKTLIKAFSLVLQKNNEFNLVILGCGELENELNDLIVELNLQNKVFLLGFKDNPYNYMKKCDLYVMSSINEGFPHTLVEAMHLKIPVISTNCKTGPKDILKNNRYGYLVPVSDYEAMAKKIDKLINSEKRLNKKVNSAYKRTLEYKADKIIKKYDDIFSEIAKK